MGIQIHSRRAVLEGGEVKEKLKIRHVISRGSVCRENNYDIQIKIAPHVRGSLTSLLDYESTSSPPVQYSYTSYSVRAYIFFIINFLSFKKVTPIQCDPPTCTRHYCIRSALPPLMFSFRGIHGRCHLNYEARPGYMHMHGFICSLRD